MMKKTRSRLGCHNCKASSLKCDELKPICTHCSKMKIKCDYSIKLTWGGRPYKSSKNNEQILGTETVVSFQKKKCNGKTDFINGVNKIRPTLEIKLHDPNAKRTMKKGVKVEKKKKMVKKTKDLNIFVDCSKDLIKANNHNNIDDDNIEDDNVIDDDGEEDITDISSTYCCKTPTMSFFAPSDTLTVKKSTPSSPTFIFLTDTFKIPQTINPLPDLLLQNESYKTHYYAYINRFSEKFCPAPPEIYNENPFTCIIPKLSITSHTDGLLSVLIAVSMTHSHRINNEPLPEESISTLINHALKDLYNRLIDPIEANSDYTLALILLLSEFELSCDDRIALNGWKAHYYGAKKIIFKKGYLKSINEKKEAKHVELSIGKETDSSFFFSRWFIFLDIFGSFSASSKNKNMNELIVWKGPTINIKDRENLNDIDRFLGFDLNLLEYFSEIVTYSRQIDSNDYEINIDIIQKSLELKERLLHYLQRTEDERDQILISKISKDNKFKQSLTHYEILRATNKVFIFSSILQIYRRILKLPKDSLLVIQLISEITQLIRLKIPEIGTAAFCTTFALLSAGSDTLDYADRLFYMNRFNSLFENGMSSVSISKDIMLECWNTDKYWADVLAEKNIDMIFL